MNYEFLNAIPGAITKGETRKRTKGRTDRKEAAVKKQVRADVDERDGFCRFGPNQTEVLYQMLGSCEGPDEWAHLEDQRRAHTRAMEPEDRHTTAGSAKMCKRHHEAYDAGKFAGAYRTRRGADGPMVWFTRDRVYQEGL